MSSVKEVSKGAWNAMVMVVLLTLAVTSVAALGALTPLHLAPFHLLPRVSLTKVKSILPVASLSPCIELPIVKPPCATFWATP